MSFPPLAFRFRPLVALGILLAVPAVGQDFPQDQKGPNWVRPYLQVGTDGTGPGKLAMPRAVAMGKGDRIIVADAGTHRLQEYAIDGTLKGEWGRAGGGPGEFLFPGGVAEGPGGEVFVADTGNDRVQVLDAQGKTLRTWGKAGVGAGEFKAPTGIAAAGGKVYVVESGQPRVQVFSERGDHQLTFGGPGQGPGLFREPSGIAVDADGNLYVADSGNHRIQKFSPKGEPLLQWGSLGAYQGYFSTPAGVACWGNRVYVTDAGNHRVQVFDRAGAYLYQWGRPPVKIAEGEGRLHFPSGIAVSATGGFTVVSEPLEARFQIFANGSARQVNLAKDLSWWDTLHNHLHVVSVPPPTTARKPGLVTPPPPQLTAIVEPEAHSVLIFDISTMPARLLVRAGNPGARLGEFGWPSSVARDPASGRFFVCERDNRRVQVFELPADPKSPTGFASWVRFIGAIDPSRAVPSSVAGYRPEWAAPESVAVDPAGKVYVADGRNAVILVFDRQLRFVRAMRPPEGKTRRLGGVAVGADGRTVYALDAIAGEVLQFDSNGAFQQAWGLLREGESAPLHPASIAVDGAGSVYVADALLRTVRIFDAKGKFLTTAGIPGRAQGRLLAPQGIALLPPDLLVVDDFGNHCGHVLTVKGVYAQMLMKGGDSMAAPPVPK